jgi:hypothetical protein
MFRTLFLILLSLEALAQDKADVLRRITTQAEQHSQVMQTVGYLSDVYGPRLMGTPNYHQALLWAEKQLHGWGIAQTQQHSFDQQHKGWEVLSYSLEMSYPGYSKLLAYPLAYTDSTHGVMEGEIVYMPHSDSVYTHAGALEGKILLMGDHYRSGTNAFEPMARRYSAEELQRAQDNPDPNDLIVGYYGRRSINQAIERQNKRREQKEKFFRFCRSQGVAALLEPSDLGYGLLHADGNGIVPSYMRGGDITPIASFVVANEHFGRLVRLLALGIKPKLKVNLSVRYHQEPSYNVNLLATIPGTDPALKEESVILGAHLDSWHAGTGAIDNASGCAVMMEAMRILQGIGIKPRRTIKLALWGGEEQIFAGSSAYVEQTLGNIRSGLRKEAQGKVSAYFNLDNGAGRIRGLYLMGNQAVKPILEKHMAPFPGDNVLTIQNANQTDHELFDVLNIPAFQFIQDPLDYMTAVHHSNMDVYEYVPEKDLQHNAKLVAYLVYCIVQQEEMLPRKKYNSPAPSLKGNTNFELKGFLEAEQVSLVGDFNNWNMFGTPLAKTKHGWKCRIDLPKGKYVYKFIVDGNWTADPATPKEKLVGDGRGHQGLTEKIVE